jgi:hypothetical protein
MTNQVLCLRSVAVSAGNPIGMAGSLSIRPVTRGRRLRDAFSIGSPAADGEGLG